MSDLWFVVCGLWFVVTGEWLFCKFVYLVGDEVELFVIEFGVHRQAQHGCCQLFCCGEVTLFVARVLIGFLKVERDGVINHRGYADLCKSLAQQVTVEVNHAQGILVIDMGGGCVGDRQHEMRVTCQMFVIESCSALPCLSVVVEVAEFDVEYGSLQAVQT